MADVCEAVKARPERNSKSLACPFGTGATRKRARSRDADLSQACGEYHRPQVSRASSNHQLDLMAGWTPVPRQQFVDFVNGMLGNTSENIGKPGLRINIVHFGGDDEAVHESRSLSAVVGAAEEPRFSSESISPQRPFPCGIGASICGEGDIGSYRVEM